MIVGTGVYLSFILFSSEKNIKEYHFL